MNRGWETRMQIWVNHVRWEAKHQPMCEELIYLCTYAIVYDRARGNKNIDWMY